MEENILEKQLSELKFIVEKYILRLLGISERNVDNVNEDRDNIKNKMIYYENNNIYFKSNKYSKICCKVSVGNWYNNMNFDIEMKVLEKILKYAPYGLSDQMNNYVDDNQKEISYEYALEYGLCSALVGEMIDCNEIYKLIRKLEEWSCKSYEGKKVPFAFVIDTKEESNDKTINYLNFLDSDFSATITDGISSIIELDHNCNLKKYLSIYNDDCVEKVELKNKNMPLRFSQVLSKYVKGERIGIFLLINGDILLSKKSELLYVKRNNKWISLLGKRYINILKENFESKNINVEFCNSIYETTLDISFSHSGGIIAIVDYEKFKNNNIMSFMDDLYSNNFNDACEEKMILFERFKTQYEERNCVVYDSKKHRNVEDDFNAMFTKRQVIKKLISCNCDTKIKFYEIDRKLRTELCALDGATILDFEGNVIAFGAIIQNQSGSSGGGRGAAASRLSSFDGFATKISADGYIELYKKGKICYQIK